MKRRGREEKTGEKRTGQRKVRERFCPSKL
jgi:hypothetical protein